MTSTKWIGYAVAVLLLTLLVGALRAHAFLARAPATLTASSLAAAPAAEPHDASKPTVAVVLGADVTEITDMLGPYELFARTGRYNVYAVAPTTASTTLTGGLRIRPHYSFNELDRLLDGRPPAIVVAPNVPNIKSPENRPLVEWVRRSASAGATSLSWCAGAAVLAEAGLLDARTATSHWGDLARLEKEYPRVHWRRGVRWIDHSNIVTSAGITSGIDATLRLLVRLHGESAARQIAEALRYPNFNFALQPQAEQYTARLSDAVLLLNAAFLPVRPQIGLALYEGVGELDVSTIYDAHAAAAVAEVHALATQAGVVRTAHGLWLEPAFVARHDADAIASLDRVIVPGWDARTRASEIARSITSVNGPVPEYLHADDPDRFSLEPILEDLSRGSNLATAAFAQRRLEYRSRSLRLESGSLFVATWLTLLVSAAALLVLRAVVQYLRRAPTVSKRSDDNIAAGG